MEGGTSRYASRLRPTTHLAGAWGKVEADNPRANPARNNVGPRATAGSQKARGKDDSRLRQLCRAPFASGGWPLAEIAAADAIHRGPDLQCTPLLAKDHELLLLSEPKNAAGLVIECSMRAGAHEWGTW